MKTIFLFIESVITSSINHENEILILFTSTTIQAHKLDLETY